MLDTRPRTIQYRFFGPVYNGSTPATNIFGSVMIAMPRISAVCTVEYFTLPPTYVLAAATRFTSVSRGYVEHLNALTLGFIGDVHSKLVEAPAIVQSSLTSTKPFVRSFTNAFKVFEANRFAFLFSLSDQCFGNSVVYNLRGRTLATRNTFECFASTTGATRLQRGASFLTRLAKLIQGLSFVSVPVRIGSNVLDAQIYPQHIFARLFFCIWHLAGSVQVKLSFDIAKVTFALSVLQQLGVMLTRHIGYFLSASYCPDRGNMFISFPGQYTSVVTNRAILTKASYLLFVQFIGISNLAHATYHRLRRKTGRSFNVMVSAVMDFILTKRFVRPSPSRNTVTGRVGFLHRSQQDFSLFVGRLQAYFSGQFHNYNIHMMYRVLKYISSEDEGFKPFRGL